MSERLDDATARKVAERFQGAGLLGQEWTTMELRWVLHGMNQRLRYALGEYDEPPPPVELTD